MDALIAAILGGIVGAFATGAVLYFLERKKERRSEAKERKAAVSVFLNELFLVVTLLDNNFHTICKMKGRLVAGAITHAAWESIYKALGSLDDNLRRYFWDTYKVIDVEAEDHIGAFIRSGSMLRNKTSHILSPQNPLSLVQGSSGLPMLAIVLTHGYRALFNLALIKEPNVKRNDLKEKIEYFSRKSEELR